MPVMANLFGSVDNRHRDSSHCRCIWVNGPVIVGAGPSGLATAACLRAEGVPFIVLERANCTASLWRNRTYDRLQLHLPKRFCQLPGLLFPKDYPEYPTRRQLIDYLDSYASHFDIHPNFGQRVQSARYDGTGRLWRVRTIGNWDAVETGTLLGRATTSSVLEIEYICRWLVVATGENAECVVPDIKGLAGFQGEVLHASDYKSGEKFSKKRVLVVGSGNSGMEVALDLCDHNAYPSIVIRSSVHVLPRDILGRSTFELAVFLARWLPIRLVDKLLVILAWLVLGDIEKFGIERPTMGPMELKNRKGKTPVLDTGALEKIRSGKIKVVPARIKRFEPSNRVEFVNGDRLKFDSVVLATGYRSNVPSWLQENELFNKDGYPKSPFPSGWKGDRGLYAVGFTGRGLSGASSDAIRVAQDIGSVWKQETEQLKKTASAVARQKRCISQLQF